MSKLALQLIKVFFFFPEALQLLHGTNNSSFLLSWNGPTIKVR